MKIFKLKKLIVAALTVMTITTVSPIGASATWKQDSNGWWNTEGNSYSIGWRNIDNTWYYFNSNGYMKTGWVNDGGKWYFMQPSGAMQTGWLSNNGTWYYLNASGDMQTGLLNLNNKTYYLDESGAMKTGAIAIGGITYAFAANGEKIYQTEAKLPLANSTTTNSTESSTGSSGSSVSDSDSNAKSDSAYESLYGTWTVTKYIAGKKLEPIILATCLNQEIIFEENSITAYNTTVPNPKIKESTVSASDFNEKWGLDVDGTIKKVKISYAESSVDIFITNDKTYALLNGALFEIEK